VTSQLTAGSACRDASVLNSVAGTGVNGTVRPDLTGAPVDGASGSTRIPRHTPRRQPGVGERLGATPSGARSVLIEYGPWTLVPVARPVQLDWRIDATNVLNA